MVILAEATADSCCPVYTCQRNLQAVCTAKRAAYTGTAWNGTAISGFIDGETGTAADICGSCQRVTKYRASNDNAGRCFPRWKCAPVEDKCCESDFFHNAAPGDYPNTGAQIGGGVYKTCNQTRDEKANCDSANCEVQTLLRPRNPKKGRCCDTYTCSIDTTCVCAGTDCPFANAAAYKEFACPDRSGLKVKKFYTVIANPSNVAAGKCCPTFICRKTAAKKVKETRLAKRKARKAAKRAALSTTNRR